MPTRTSTRQKPYIQGPTGVVLACVFGALSLVPARAEPQSPPRPASWTYTWDPAPGETSAPTVAICPLPYDKVWAYAVEIDDGPASTLTVAQPLLARFAFTDAPPGLPGGKSLPFVGGAAVIVERLGTSNPAYLGWEQLRKLEREGWGLLNHSYWHTGNHWDPARALKPADLRRELFWSRALIAGPPWDRDQPALRLSQRRHPLSPLPDRVRHPLGLAAGGTCRTLLADAAAWLDLDRNNLDEAGWARSGDPMLGFPPSGPVRGDLIIDFTHDINPRLDSPNHHRWAERLARIARRHGKEGADTVWSAPTTRIIDYTLAARAATVQVERGRLSLQFPETAPETPLTLKLTGLDERSRLSPPPGGVLYRSANQAWITTPALPDPRSRPHRPTLERIYEGPPQQVPLDPPRQIAGVRLLQSGEAAPLRVTLIHPDGTAEPLVTGEAARVEPAWGKWLLLPTLPDRPAICARGVRVEPDPALTRMEVWALAEGPDR